VRTHAHITRFASAAGLAALALLLAPAASLAANVTATGTISGTTLSVSTSASPNFSANLDNGDSTPTYTVPLTTQDTRGTGAGWNETITSTQFTTGAPNNYTLDTSASTVSGVTQSSGSGTNTAPTNGITYPLAVPAGSTAPTAVKLYNAAANTGMGRFTITPTVGVFVPQNSFAGTYTSTLTLALVSGP
jgi:WxL domain surface cell wall-binding